MDGRGIAAHIGSMVEVWSAICETSRIPPLGQSRLAMRGWQSAEDQRIRRFGLTPARKRRMSVETENGSLASERAGRCGPKSSTALLKLTILDCERTPLDRLRARCSDGPVFARDCGR